jgi:hypothetical protein
MKVFVRDRYCAMESRKCVTEVAEIALESRDFPGMRPQIGLSEDDTRG